MEMVMKSTILRKKEIDFEELGNQTMVETGDEAIAKDICGHHIHVLALVLNPRLMRLSSAIEEKQGRRQSLCSHLYDRHVPVSDAKILGLAIAAGILAVMTVVAAVASLGGHAMAFYLFGTGVPASLLMGVVLTGIATASGYQAYEKIIVRHKFLEGIVIFVAFALCLWGLLQVAQARGTMVEKLVTSTSAKSFVDDSANESKPAESARDEESGEQRVRGLLGSAMVKIMISADLILGLLLGVFVKIWTDDDFVAWHDLKKTAKSLGHLQEQSNELRSSVEIANKLCMAGILRAKHAQRKKCVPYHKALLTLLVVLLLALPHVFAQTINRHEGMVIDVSGSIGKGGTNDDLFREYLFSVKKLLLTEPPNSRVWVSVITTESFGSVRSLVKGWTPDAQGVFTDDLNRARNQLAANFEAKSAGLTPTAAGTDIIGALWQMKALLESGSKSSSDAVSKSIWIFSDMMNESANFNMPALLPAGPERLIERAKANGLMVPLAGYRVYVVGASPAGLSPQAWNALKAFWALYFREAGAELVSYSAECGVERE
jgi:hypothetical protein